MPQIGVLERLLSDKQITYRSIIINKKGKMIYRIEGEIIYIVDFWDCRREPKKLIEGL